MFSTTASIPPIFKKKMTKRDGDQNEDQDEERDQHDTFLQQIRDDLLTLHHALQNMLQMMDSVGGARDSRRLRKAIQNAKNRSLDMSKSIHWKLTEGYRESDDDDDDDDENGEEERAVSKRNAKQNAFVVKLQNDYKELLAKQQIIYQQFTDMEKKYPAKKLGAEETRQSMQQNSALHALNEMETPPRQQKHQQLQQQEQVVEGEHQIVLQENLNPIILEEYDYDEQDAQYNEEMMLIEEDMDDLVEMFLSLDSNAREQEQLLVGAEKEIAKAQHKTHKGTKDLQHAHRYAAAGLMVAGGMAGVLVGGPVGAVVGLKVAGITAGIGLAGGTVIGLTGGLGLGMVSKKVMNRINAANVRHSKNISTQKTKEKQPASSSSSSSRWSFKSWRRQ